MARNADRANIYGSPMRQPKVNLWDIIAVLLLVWIAWGAGSQTILLAFIAGGLYFLARPYIHKASALVHTVSPIPEFDISQDDTSSVTIALDQDFDYRPLQKPPADGIDRTNFENVSVAIGAGSAGATHARVKYGYEENEGTRGTTWPAAIHFYCTQYQGTCYSANQNLTLNSTPNLAIGVPQRVLFYQVEYLNAANAVVATDPVTMAAIP
jgi:hypothetical protein